MEEFWSMSVGEKIGMSILVLLIGSAFASAVLFVIMLPIGILVRIFG